MTGLGRTTAVIAMTACDQYPLLRNSTTGIGTIAANALLKAAEDHL